MNWLQKISERLIFSGFHDGGWSEGLQSHANVWTMTGEKGKGFYVENATEYHEQFRKALAEISSKYDLNQETLDFDGNKLTVSEVLSMPSLDLGEIQFYHGTSELRWQKIQSSGFLLPRSKTGIETGYGSQMSHVSLPNSQAVYLTAEKGMAQWAARDAAVADNSKKVILLVGPGLIPDYMIADEDSKVHDAKTSLEIMGSIGYLKPIPLSIIQQM